MIAVQVGDHRDTVVVEQLTRTQIVQYAGASGDFNPIHTDETYAVDTAGLPSVLGHGMLTLAATARVITDWFGPDRIRALSGSFRSPVWPGDTITASAFVEEIESGDDTPRIRVGLEARNQHGHLVLQGHATVGDPL